MDKRKLLIMFLAAIVLCLGFDNVRGESQTSHDSASIIERSKRRITPEQRKAAALRAADARAKAVLDSTSSDTTSSDTATTGKAEGGTTNE